MDEGLSLGLYCEICVARHVSSAYKSPTAPGLVVVVIVVDDEKEVV